MSNKLAKKTQAFFVKILLLLLIVSFGLWGIGDMVTPALQGGSVATVDDQEIAAPRVYQDIQRELQRMRQVTGQAEVDESFSALVANSVVDRAVNAKLIEVLADDLDVAISDKLVSEAIRNNELFQDAGTFSRARFDQVMFSNDFTENQFIELVRADLAREQVVSILLNGVNIAKPTTEALYRHLEERRVVEYVSINTADLTLSNTPDESALRQYYSDNQAQFMAPEYRSLSLLHVTPADVAETVDVPLEDIENAYSQRLNEFQVPEKRKISQMVFETQTDAQAAIELIQGGKNFNDVAQEKLGLDAASVELGDLERSALPDELQAPAFDLVEGAISQPIESLLGWHVLTVTGITGGTTQSFEEVQDQLKNELALLQASEELFDISNTVEDNLAGGASIEEAANSVGRDLFKVNATDAQGLDQQGTPVPALENFALIIQEAFNSTPETEPQMRDDGEGGYFLVRVDQIIESQPRPFETIQDQVLTNLSNSLKDDQAANLTKELSEKLSGSTALSEIASDKGLLVQQSEPFTRQNTPFNEALTTDVFGATEGNVLSGESETGYIVAVVKEIVPFTQASESTVFDNLQAQLNASIANDLQAQFVSALRREYPVSINQSMINAMLNQQNQGAR